MEDLFPETRRPQSLGADAIPYLCSTFFAIYPEKRDVPRVVEWQRSICGQGSAPLAMRPANVLHVSVAECGKPQRKLQPLPDAMSAAARHFSFPAFELVFDSVARFGNHGRACVALADAASQAIFGDLRAAIADAQRHVGMFVSRGRSEAHLTLGYGEESALERRSIEPFGFRVAAVEFVASEWGKSNHVHLVRWALDQT